MADPAKQKATTHNEARYPAGVVVSWNKGERAARFPNLQSAITEASAQRTAREPFELWDGREWRKEGSTPIFDVQKGESVEDAKQRRG